ncbi:hypothetical protein PBS_29170 [Paraburkholderia sp. 2C]
MSSSAGASTPISAYGGSTAMTSEPPHIMNTDTIIAKRRPRLSARRPKNQPPIGRIRKPAANTPAVLSSCVVVSPFGKNAGAK